MKPVRGPAHDLRKLSVVVLPCGRGYELEVLSDVELATEITTWAGQIAAGKARLVGLIRPSPGKISGDFRGSG